MELSQRIRYVSDIKVNKRESNVTTITLYEYYGEESIGNNNYQLYYVLYLIIIYQ